LDSTESPELHGPEPRRRIKRKRGVPMPVYARVAFPLLAVALAGAFFWHGSNPERAPAAPVPVHSAEPAAVTETVRTVAWERDVIEVLASAARNGEAGNITAAEVDVDRADSILTAARLQSRTPSPEFIGAAVGGLDRALKPHGENPRLFEHVTDARIELAALRSSQNVEGGAAPETGSRGTGPDSAGTGATAQDYYEVGAASARKKVTIAAPRAVGADTTLNPAALGGNYIDATLMPESAEALLFPQTRLLSDNVRVEDLTMQGAAETLDGVHWRNVTFIGTRLRYEGGALDLQNVRFVRCSFGFATTTLGAQLADAIALGRTSFSGQP
jgi:hypothetical protein